MPTVIILLDELSHPSSRSGRPKQLEGGYNITKSCLPGEPRKERTSKIIQALLFSNNSERTTRKMDRTLQRITKKGKPRNRSRSRISSRKATIIHRNNYRRPTNDVIRLAISTLNNSTAAGPGSMPTEALKAAGIGLAISSVMFYNLSVKI